MQIKELSGFVLRKSFTLQAPCLIEKTPDHFKIDDCRIHMAHGDLFASLYLDKQDCKAKVKAEHFPIDLLTFSHPLLSLEGSATLDGFLEASKEKIEGKLNIYLEEAGVMQLGKAAPLNAKGSLQAYLNDKNMQLHAHVKATKEQFFDLTATLPIDYTVYPFNISLNPERPLSSELTMEGKLEEIFDFVNIGSHHATGLLSAHLFLSKNILSPSLQGLVELEGSTYENYFTGTSLRNIEAKIEAKNKQLDLVYFKARDQDEGTIAATGTLEMLPSKKFPYSIHADLVNLNALSFDVVDSNFTGPLDITGTAEQALAKGILNVTAANLRIPDEIPLDIPILPVTYINPPSHLNAQSIHPVAIFPMKLDLDLSAKDHIFVRGKGLTSEWKGDVHLTGTNMQFAASGKLNLLKGDFLFSGKTFALTQGEILF